MTPMKTQAKFFRFWCLLLVLVAGLSTPRAATARNAGSAENAAILAPSYVMMDVDTGRVLAARAEHVRRYPASTTKTMTALIAIEKGDLGRVVTIGPNPPKTGESSAYLLQGETFTLYELLEAALIKSANDSCVAIAEAVAGTVPKFVALMNEKAKEVGAKDTHFANPHGLHDPNHYTTAYDLALIACAALKYPVFNEIIATKKVTIHGNAKIGAHRVFLNHNRLLLRWDACDGVKTGYTRQAGRCLIASATRVDPRTHRPWRLLCVVMHSPDSWKDSRHLLEQGFKKYSPVVVAQSGQTLAKLEVAGGASPVQAMAAHEIRLPLRSAERAALTTHIHPLALKAPVQKDQTVAQLEWRLNGKVIGKAPLVAREAVGKSLMARLAPASLPTLPSMRWSLYGCAAFGILLISLGWKVRAHERKRQQERARRRRTARQLFD
jgi:D-alanyl-D-alanine carboxypeptidase (penicillin-binding protein 5/6)